jgi:hypothetical protein
LVYNSFITDIMLKELEIRIKHLEQRLDTLSDQLSKALIYIEDDPHSSLTKSRTILEQILLNIYKLEMDQEPKRVELGAILTDNQFTRKIDKRIVSRMNAIRDMCNLGVHGEKVVSKDAKIVLDNLCEVLEWYFENYKTIKTNKEHIFSPEKNIRKSKKKLIIMISGIFFVIFFTAIIITIYKHKSDKTNLISPTNYDPIKGKYYALIIGIDEYSDPQIVDLNSSIKVAESFFNLITTKYTFNESEIKLLRNATYNEIIDALDYFAKMVGPRDNFLVFYSGHSIIPEGADYSFWLPSDAKESDKRNWLRNSMLRDFLAAVSSKHTLLISDGFLPRAISMTESAFSGPSQDINLLNGLISRKAITATSLNVNPDNSVFLKYLILSLQDNREKYLTDEALFRKLLPRVLNQTDIPPQFFRLKECGDEGGDLIFVLK